LKSQAEHPVGQQKDPTLVNGELQVKQLFESEQVAQE